MTNVVEQTPDVQATGLSAGGEVPGSPAEAAETSPAKQAAPAKKAAAAPPKKASPTAPVPSVTPGSWRSKSRDKCETEAATAVRNNKFMQLSELLRNDNGDDDAKSARMLSELRTELEAGRVYAVPLSGEKIMLIGVGEVTEELIAVTPTFEVWREEFNLNDRVERLRREADVTFDPEQARRFFMTIAGARVHPDAS